MSKQIFDQDRPKSTMAQRLDEAFAGCEVWTLAPPSPRRSSLDPSPHSPSPSRLAASAAPEPFQESRAL